MLEEKELNRTWLCSVVFSDLINYSSQSVSTQSEWKTFLNSSLANAIKSVVTADRVIIDTGDGAAICFLGDPESAILCSLAILNDFKERERAGGSAPRIRLGVHLGPIKLVRDLNGNLNAIGDGINVGQRIMSFADGDQILVSRPYFEVVSRLSDEYSRLFKFEGVRQDKHIREHAIYALIPSFSGLSTAPGVASEGGPIETTSREEPPAVFDEQSVAAVGECLRDFVGPVALHLVRVESRTAKDLPGLCDALAKKALPPQEREKFLQACRAKAGLGELLKTVAPASGSVVPAGETSRLPTAKPNWDDKFLNSLKKQLTEHLGPVASVVVDRAARKASSSDELMGLLAEYFPPSPKKKR